MVALQQPADDHRLSQDDDPILLAEDLVSRRKQVGLLVLPPVEEDTVFIEIAIIWEAARVAEEHSGSDSIAAGVVGQVLIWSSPHQWILGQAEEPSSSRSSSKSGQHASLAAGKRPSAGVFG